MPGHMAAAAGSPSHTNATLLVRRMHPEHQESHHEDCRACVGVTPICASASSSVACGGEGGAVETDSLPCHRVPRPQRFHLSLFLSIACWPVARHPTKYGAHCLCCKLKARRESRRSQMHTPRRCIPRQCSVEAWAPAEDTCKPINTIPGCNNSQASPSWK